MVVQEHELCWQRFERAIEKNVEVFFFFFLLIDEKAITINNGRKFQTMKQMETEITRTVERS